MHYKFKGINEAFDTIIKDFDDRTIQLIATDTRNGPVLQAVEPVIVTYLNPLQRVLFNIARDCNPFFHVAEALWMLNGNNNVDYLTWFNSGISKYSDDGKTLHGAYGHRWREYFGYDQLDWIIEELTANPSSRRCVLQMWDGGRTEFVIDRNSKGHLLNTGTWEAIDGTGDLYTATHGGKDVPCNISAMFLVNNGKLDMTVCNRSNDAIWGMLGANVVHFSFLQEYMAAGIGVPVGFYHQITNNLHVYLEKFEPAKWLSPINERLAPAYYSDEWNNNQLIPLVYKRHRFDHQLAHFIDNAEGCPIRTDHTYEEPFLVHVAIPMFKAFARHKDRDYEAALKTCDRILSIDWRIASYNWISKRQQMWNDKVKNDTNTVTKEAGETDVEN